MTKGSCAIDNQVAADEFIAALAALEDMLSHLPEFATAIIERAERIRTLRSKGQPYREIVPQEQRPLIVELLTANLEMLSAVGSRLRRAEARALYDEGLTMDEIATLFGVSRQRIANAPAIGRTGRPGRTLDAVTESTRTGSH